MNEIAHQKNALKKTRITLVILAFSFLAVPYSSLHAKVFVVGVNANHEMTAALLQQQNNKRITGQVVDDRGEPVAGANISEVGINANGVVSRR